MQLTKNWEWELKTCWFRWSETSWRQKVLFWKEPEFSQVDRGVLLLEPSACDFFLIPEPTCGWDPDFGKGKFVRVGELRGSPPGEPPHGVLQIEQTFAFTKGVFSRKSVLEPEKKITNTSVLEPVRHDQLERTHDSLQNNTISGSINSFRTASSLILFFSENWI